MSLSFMGLQILKLNGNNIKAAMKKRKKASVNGGIFCSASLYMGGDAPQIILVIIIAKTAMFINIIMALF